MKIGIVGAGHIGSALAKLALRAGHSVMIGNSRGPETLVDVVAEIGCTAGTADDVARFADVAVVTVPFSKVEAFAALPLAGKVVIDTNNYYPDRDGRIVALDHYRTTTSEMVAAWLPGTRIVKAFNAILAADLDPDRSGPPRVRALPIAGDDLEAKHIVAALHREFGFDPVDAGGLATSWRFERAKPAYCIPYDRAGLTVALAAAEREGELPHGSWRR